MTYLKPQPIPDPSLMMESATNAPDKERMADGYNTYDNVLKLVEIKTYTINIPDISIDSAGTGGYQQDYLIEHNVKQTPFIEVEWRDPSTVTLEEFNIIYLTSIFNQSRIKLTFFQSIARLGPPYDQTPIPAKSYTVKIYIYKLNTKLRLDTYIK